MPKISELFDESKPGSVKLTKETWERDVWFQPYFIIEGKVYGKKSNSAQAEWTYKDGDNWQIWEEPKQQEKRFLWLSPERGKLYYLTKLEAETSLNDPIRLTSKMIDEGF